MQNGIVESQYIWPYGDHAGAAKRLKDIHDIFGLSWPKIARLEEYQGIPASTLRDIAESGIVPKCHRAQLGVGAIDNRPRRAINLIDMQSAANTILNHVKPQWKIIELINSLEEGLAENEIPGR